MTFKKIAIGIAAAGLLLAGCGGASAAGTPGKDAGTTITKANFASAVAKAQQNAGTGHMKMTTSAGGQALDAEADFATGADLKSTKMAMKMSVAGQTLEMRMLDNIMYMNMGPLTQSKFVAIDLSDKTNPLVKQFGSVVDQADPSKSLDIYQDSLKSFKKSGATKKIDGVDTQPYELVLDMKKYLASTGAGDEVPSAAAAGDVKVTMFIGKDNLIRRTQTSFMGTDVTVDFSKWGEDVKVAKPSADQIGDSKQLESMLSGAGSGS